MIRTMENTPSMSSERIDRQLFIVIVQEYDDAAFRQNTLQSQENAEARKRTIAQSGTDECNLGLLCSGNPLNLSATGRPDRAADQVATPAEGKKHKFTSQGRPI